MSVDEQLAKAQAGDMSAFGNLVRMHEQSIYSLALRMLGRREPAEDVTQEVFMQLHGKLGSIESGSHLTFWLRRVTTHRVIDHLRQRPPVTLSSLQDEAESVSPHQESDPLLERHLRKLLLTLSAPARAVVVLRFQEDLDPAEIARTLDMPLNTVKSHLKRSLDSLRIRMLSRALVASEDPTI